MTLFEMQAETLVDQYHTTLIGCLGVGLLLLFFWWISTKRKMSLVALLALLGYGVCGVMVNEGLKYFYYDSFIQADLDKNDGLLRLTFLESHTQTIPLTEIKDVRFGKSGKSESGCYLTIYLEKENLAFVSGKAERDLSYCKSGALKLRQALEGSSRA